MRAITRRQELAVAVVCAVALVTPGLAQPPAARVTALVGGTLIDGFGGRPLRNSVVVVEGERISAVGTVGTLPVPGGAEVISTEGMSVLPGLWDMHVHLMLNGHGDYAHWDKTYLPQLERVIMPSSAKQLLLAGVTSARDLGAPIERFDHCPESHRQGRADWRDHLCLWPVHPTCAISRH